MISVTLHTDESESLSQTITEVFGFKVELWCWAGEFRQLKRNSRGLLCAGAKISLGGGHGDPSLHTNFHV